MKRTIRTFIFCAVIGIASSLKGQEQITLSNDSPNSILLVSIDQAGDEIIQVMDNTQLSHFHDPQTPRFVLTDRKGNFALGIGGYVRAVAEYDFGGIVNSVDFIPALIPNHSKINNQIQMDASTANIFIKLVGKSPLLGNFIVHTEGNYRGNDNTFKLRNAYLAFKGITIGYTYGGFMDAAAMSPTVDFQGPNGGTFYRSTQLAYTYKGWSKFNIGATVEMPKVDGTTGEDFDIAQQRMPDFTLSAKYLWDNQSHVRLAGIIRNMTYTSEFRKKPSDVFGYGIQASSTFSVGKSMRFYGQFTYGKGIGLYLNDLGELNVDLVTNGNDKEKLQALPMMGWFAGLQYNITPNIFVSGTYSASRIYSEDGYATANPDNYHYGQYAVGNLFWNASNNLQMGIEYLSGWKTTFNRDTHHANRICLMTKYSF